MNKLKFGIVTILFAGLALPSCIDHEVIPAPIPQVELKCNFKGYINGTDVTLTQNINGYYGWPTKSKFIAPPPDWSSAVYYSEIKSDTYPVSIKVGLGSVVWDASTVADPTLTLFNDFFQNNLTPAYSNSAASGFEVQYKDASGNVWTSKETGFPVQSSVFSSLKQESDSNGDFSKFSCSFNCYVYRIDDVTMLLDSVRIQNAVFKGWFKR